MIQFTRAEADEQFNPILWTRRMPTDDLLPKHAELTTTRSEAYRARLAEQLQIRTFGADDLAGTMDVYRPEGLAEDASIVVYIHGGWWQWFSREQFGFLAEPFNTRGFAVVMPGYRMAQDWQSGMPMQSIVRQMELALAAVLEEAVIRGAPSVYVIGHSAGGHLAAMLHRTDWSALGVPEAARSKLRAVFSLAGLFDLRPLVDSYVNDEIKMTIADAERVSPHVLPAPATATCPLHLVLPEYDTPEFFRQTKAYQEKLLRAGHVCHLHVVDERDHLDLIERMTEDGDPLLTTILSQMARAEVEETSRRWISSFNAGNVSVCAEGYADHARMRAMPMGEFSGRESIEAFWREFVSSTGAADLVYSNVRINVETADRVRLSAEWRMNVGRGIITNELWVRQTDGVFRLEEDDFVVQERFSTA